MHVLEQAALGNRLTGLPGDRGQLLLILLEIEEVGTLNPARHAFEAQVYHIVGKTNRFKQLRTAIGGNGGDTHLRQDLQQALVDALTVIVLGFDRIHQHFAGANQIVQDLVRQVRVDRRSAKSEQYRKVMRIPSPAGLNNDVGIAAQTSRHQVMVHCAGGHQGIDRKIALSQVLIA